MRLKNNKIRSSLKYSFLDGAFASSMVGMTTDYIAPYALALRASVSQIGFLSAFSNFFSSLIQLKSADLSDKWASRKKIITLFVLLHLLMAIPIILIPYIFKSHQVIFLILFVALFNGFNAFAAPVWSSLMADYIPYRKRGQYFGWRNKILAVVTIVSSLLAGLILQYFKFKGNVFLGFTVIFTAAFTCRFISWYFLTRMYEPRYKVKREAYFSLFDFIKRVRESNFAKFVIFVAGLNFCVNLAAPFFSVFMLRDLKLNYITYTVIVTTVTAVHIFTIGRWGRHADKVGNIKVLRFTSLLISTLPLWWLVSSNPAYLVFTQVAAGFAWAGFNLCAANFIYDAVTPEKRTRCIAYFNVLNGLALSLGAILGGYLVNILPPFMGYRLLTLFILSSILRFLVVSVMSRRIKEVRITEKISSLDLFYSVIGIKPMLGVTEDSRQLIRKEE